MGLGAAGALTLYMLGLGAWRSRSKPGEAPPEAPDSPHRPIALSRMDWRLTDHRGRAVRPADWLGRPVMALFGFTWCPDVCPTTLLDVAAWLEELGPAAERLTVALITVDPERDTPEVLAEYVEMFDARILGVTGEPAQIARAAADFRARYAKIPTGEGEYTMDHTAGVFLFRADGRFASLIDFHEDRQFALPKIRRILG